MLGGLCIRQMPCPWFLSLCSLPAHFLKLCLKEGCSKHPGYICPVLCSYMLVLQAENSLSSWLLVQRCSESSVTCYQISKQRRRQAGVVGDKMSLISEGLHHGYRRAFWVTGCLCTGEWRSNVPAEAHMIHMQASFSWSMWPLLWLFRKGFGCGSSTEVGPLIIAVASNTIPFWLGWCGAEVFRAKHRVWDSAYYQRSGDQHRTIERLSLYIEEFWFPSPIPELLSTVEGSLTGLPCLPTFSCLPWRPGIRVFSIFFWLIGLCSLPIEKHMWYECQRHPKYLDHTQVLLPIPGRFFVTV